jgi:hypothetical protein
MPGAKTTPDPVVDYWPNVPWTLPNPGDPAHPWVEIPLHGDGTPNWPPDEAGGYPNGPWDPLNPQPGPHGRTIIYSPGPPSVLRINCGGGYYEIPWADLCNTNDAPVPAPKPSGPCSNGFITELQIIALMPRKYIRDLDGSVQITSTLEYTFTASVWECQFVWVQVGHPKTQTEYSERSYIFQCC